MSAGSLLAPLAAAYGAAVSVREALYRKRWIRIDAAPRPVISVGNLVAGGTGKTPVVALAARILDEAGMRPAVVSRGYGGRRRQDPLVVAEAGSPPPLASALEAGDEPVMLARMLEGVPIVVARRRVEGARLAVERLGARTLILDDGFQHRALRRDLDLVLLDAESPFDNGRLLPAGMLREPPAALARAGAVAFTFAYGSQTSSAPGSAGLTCATLAEEAEVARWIRPGTPVLRFRLEPTLLVSARDVDPGVRPGPETLTAAWLAGMRIVAFTGIARPQRLVADLRRLGGEVVYFAPFPDHHVFTPSEVREILAAVRRLEPEVVLTTEKDVARLKSVPHGAALIEEGVVALRVEAVPEDGGAGTFRRLLLEAAGAGAAA